jgi:hypothetical protein
LTPITSIITIKGMATSPHTSPATAADEKLPRPRLLPLTPLLSPPPSPLLEFWLLWSAVLSSDAFMFATGSVGGGDVVCVGALVGLPF